MVGALAEAAVVSLQPGGTGWERRHCLRWCTATEDTAFKQSLICLSHCQRGADFKFCLQLLAVPWEGYVSPGPDFPYT